MTESRWVVHKFGGTSVADSKRYQLVAGIVVSQPGARKAIVVSAMSKVTDALIELVELARQRDETYHARLEVLREKHLGTLREILPGSDSKSRMALEQVLEKDFKDIAEVLRGVYLVQNYSDRVQELISGYGEIWSAQFLDACLRSQGIKSGWLDARKLLCVEPGEPHVTVDWKTSREKTAKWLVSGSPDSSGNSGADIVVITGFIASTPDGIPTTLKRNGSDYSASIFGSLLDAEAISIWTDVDGVLTADPRRVPDAVVLDELSYSEATELAYFGAKVVHPSTMAPAIERKIPIWIRNTFNSSHRGTCIHDTTLRPRVKSRIAVKGFSTVDGVALINVEGTGMIGVPGVAQRLFGSLRDVGVSVIMISQASSEHSICFAIPQAQAVLAKSTVEKAFFAEIHHGEIQKVEVTPDCSILAAVGDDMVDSPGTAAVFFTALSRARVNVRAIAQGSSERNISTVVDGKDATRALRAVHSGFYLSSHTFSIGVIGAGLIGGTFLSQLSKELARLNRDSKLDLRVRGIMDSKKMLLDPQKIDLSGWSGALAASSVAADPVAFSAHIAADHLPHAVIIDCTASETVAANYARWLAAGIHVITPNKKAGAGSMDFYREIRAAAVLTGRHWLYRTTVGAGLPLLHTVHDLVQTGDRILEIEGVLSGTLSFIFNSYDGTRAFSEIVKEARAKGLTEPDPRDDLSGTDVARKLVILAREAGLGIQLADVKVESLVPYNDEAMLKQLEQANSRNEVLRYVGALDLRGPEPCATVALKSYPRSHPFSAVHGSDNIVAFKTERYNSNPLVIQGPGAGPEVTAAGVFADLLRLTSNLGAVL